MFVLVHSPVGAWNGAMTLDFARMVRHSQLAFCGLAVGLLVAAGCKRSETSGTAPAAEKASTPAATAAAEPAAATPADNLEKLRGRWLRPDGGYVLAIGAIDSEGRTEARYFNPSPVNVAWARVRNDAGGMKLDVELRDTNYPGCLYKLNYLPETDRLVGTYFQAQMQETHEVAFVRDRR
jgi:hypothetical protein